MGEGNEQQPRLDWDSAPDHFREEYEQAISELKDLKPKVQRFERQQAFDAAVKEAGDEAQGVTLDDLADVEPDQISPTLVRTKAAEKREEHDRVLREIAQQKGFEDPDAFVKAVEGTTAEQAEQNRAMADNAAVAATGQQPQGSEQTDTVSLRDLEKRQAAGQVTNDQVAALVRQGKVVNDAGEVIAPR